MRLNELRDNDGARTERKRVGRGAGSGTGKTSGKGHKGQKSRAGATINGFEGGQMPIYRRLPKRGFKNPFRKEFSIINLKDIDKAILSKKLNPSKEIAKTELFKAGLIRKNSLGIKLLANGELSHSITIKVDKASKKASESISKSKGKLILEVSEKKSDQKKQKPKKQEQ